MQFIRIEFHSIIVPSQASIPFHAHVSSQTTALSQAGPCPSHPRLLHLPKCLTLPDECTLPGSCPIPGPCRAVPPTLRLLYLWLISPPRLLYLPDSSFTPGSITCPCRDTIRGPCPIPGLSSCPSYSQTTALPGSCIFLCSCYIPGSFTLPGPWPWLLHPPRVLLISGLCPFQAPVKLSATTRNLAPSQTPSPSHSP